MLYHNVTYKNLCFVFYLCFSILADAPSSSPQTDMSGGDEKPPRGKSSACKIIIAVVLAAIVLSCMLSQLSPQSGQS